MPDGNNATIPDFALDSTAQLLLKQLVGLNKNNATGLKDLLDHAKEQAKLSEKERKLETKARDELHSTTEELAKNLTTNNTTPKQPVVNVGPETTGGKGVGQLSGAATNAANSLDGFNKGAAIGEKAFVSLYDGAKYAIIGVATTITAYGAILLDSFVGLGNELNELTKSGVAFGDGLSQGGMTATGAMVQLSGMGLNAAQTLSQFSGVVQSMGKQAFVGMTEQFLELTGSGADLGMSLDDSVERMGAEMQKRQAMGLLGAANEGRMQKQIIRSIKTQQKYSTVLGESVDGLVAFTDSLVTQTPALTANLSRMNADLRSKVIGGITDFGTTMRAMGGEEGGAIAAAMTEAAAGGAMGFSDSMAGYIGALPSLAGPMNQYIKAINNGSLSQEDAEKMGVALTAQLGNVSKAEKNRIFALARGGDAQAQSMSKAITQFETSARKLKDMDKSYSMEGVQKGTNTLTAIFKEFTGTFESFKTSFLMGFGSITDGGKGLSDLFFDAKQTISDSINVAMGKFGLAGNAFDSLTGTGESLGKQLGDRLPKIIETVVGYITGFIEKLPDIVDGVKSFARGFMTVMKILGFAIKVVMIPINLLAGVVSGVVSVFQLAIDVLLGTVQIVGGLIKSAINLALVPFKLIGLAVMSVVGVMGDVAKLVISAVLAPFKWIGAGIGKIYDWIVSPFKAVGDGIEKAGSTVMAPVNWVGGVFTSFGKMIKPVLNGISDAFKKLGEFLDPVFGPVIDGFKWVGSGLARIGTGITDFISVFTGGGFFSTVGKLVGAVGVVLFAMSKMGVALPGFITEFGKKIGGGAKKVAGGLKDKIMGKSKGADIKGMDAVNKKAGSLTKSIGKGMSNISKGIGDMLKNLSKGIGSVISNLAKSVGKAGASLGKGLGDMVGGALKGIGKGLSAIGNPKALLGTVVLAALGASMFIAGKAFQQFANINWAGVGMGMLALGALGVAAFLLAPIAPVLAVGAAAIGMLGLALVPFAYAVSLAAPAMVELMGSFKLLNDVDAMNVMKMGPALVSLAVGMAAFSAGGLVGSIMDGLGSLFGADSPFDKIAKLGKAAVPINEMTKGMKGMSGTVDTFNSALLKLDGTHMKGEFIVMAEGIDRLNESMSEISLVSLMKMAAMKSFGPIQSEETAEPEKPKLTDKDYAMARAGDPDAQARVDAGQTQEQKDEKAKVDKSIPGQILADTGTEENPFAVPLEQAKEALNTAIAAQAAGLKDGVDWIAQTNLDNDVKWAQIDLDDANKVDKEAATKVVTKVEQDPVKVKVDRSAAGRAKRRRATAANGGIASTVSPEDAARAKAQAPAVAKAMNPAGETVTTAGNAKQLADKKPDTDNSNDSTAGESNSELLKNMIKAQEQTNKLLKSGNRITSDLSDEF